MIRLFSVLFLAAVTTWTHAAEEPLKLASSAPERYVVVRGDTLWDISAKFLSQPWHWPEIWRMNKGQIKNPHRIYPGDVIVLGRDASGSPLLRLESNVRPQVYSEQLTQAIPPIPPNVIEPFISAPLIIEEGGLDAAAKIVATQEDRVFLGKGDTAYVTNADPSQKNWTVFRRGEPLYDPENPQRILGYEAFHLGSATQVRPGDPAIFEIVTAKQEIGANDRLIPALRPQLVDYVPHKPTSDIAGRVVSVYGGVGTGGRLSIVSLNRGSADGVEIGHVVALEKNRTVAQRDENDQKTSVVIPAVRYGLAFVFRTFDQISYALVVQSDGTVEVNDFISTP